MCVAGPVDHIDPRWDKNDPDPNCKECYGKGYKLIRPSPYGKTVYKILCKCNKKTAKQFYKDLADKMSDNS